MLLRVLCAVAVLSNTLAQVAIIFGGTRGIGEAVAKHVASHGVKVPSTHTSDTRDKQNHSLR
jgi:NAD(P)-dependent dehydrogenase (short-subunit alcohol dehydrogenase family)